MPAATATRKRVAKKVPAPAPTTNHGRGQIQVRLPQELIDRLDVEAERRRVSKTFLVEQMINTSLPRWEEQSITAL